MPVEVFLHIFGVPSVQDYWVCFLRVSSFIPKGAELLFGSPEFVSFTPANDSWLGQRSYQGRS